MIIRILSMVLVSFYNKKSLIQLLYHIKDKGEFTPAVSIDYQTYRL
jgi:hypothetical protein